MSLKNELGLLTESSIKVASSLPCPCRQQLLMSDQCMRCCYRTCVGTSPHVHVSAGTTAAAGDAAIALATVAGVLDGVHAVRPGLDNAASAAAAAAAHAANTASRGSAAGLCILPTCNYTIHSLCCH